MELQEGEYFIPDGCTAKFVGRVVVYKRKSKKLAPTEYRCKDCKHRREGYCFSRQRYRSWVCELKPKSESGLYYCAPQYGKPCFEDCFNEINMELTSENVGRVFRECLSDEKEGDNVRLVEAVLANVKMAMRRDKLKFYQEEIQGMLMQLPRKFRETDGGGWSFLNLCTREDGTQWTGSHATMEQLVILGVGCGKMKYLLPKSMWNILPGGMPYLAVLDKYLQSD